MNRMKLKKQKYPLVWQKDDFSIKVFCSIPNVATGILLKAADSLFVVDPGDGILRDLNKDIGTGKILEISDVFVTHGHHDHVGGLWSFLTYLRVMNKRTPLHIHYPEGCIEIESIYNAFRQVYPNSITYPIKLNKISTSDKFTRNKVSIKPFEVVHKEFVTGTTETKQVPAVGFKFTFEGKKICYGGDTAWCRNLITMVKESDLAIIQAGHEDNIVDDMHLSFSEAEQIGQTAKEHFLVHVPE